LLGLTDSLLYRYMRAKWIQEGSWENWSNHSFS